MTSSAAPDGPVAEGTWVAFQQSLEGAARRVDQGVPTGLLLVVVGRACARAPVAERLNAALRPQDTVLTLGEDRLLVLLPGVLVGTGAAAAVLERMRVLADSPVAVPGGWVEPRVDLSACALRPGLSVEEHLREAELGTAHGDLHLAARALDALP